MAVGFDVASESHAGTTGSASQASFTWNHAGGTPRGALVFVFSIGALTDTSVTYGGVSMTAVPYTAADTDTEPGSVRAYYLDNCGSGTQAVVVNSTNNAVVMYAVCFTVSAATATQVYLPGIKTAGGSTSATAASSSGTGTGTVALMVVDDGSPGTSSLRFMGRYQGTSNVTAAGSGSTAGPSIDFGLFVIDTFRETTAGQGARNVGGATITDDVAAIGLAVRELAVTNVSPGGASGTGSAPAATATTGGWGAWSATFSNAVSSGTIVNAGGAAATGTGQSPSIAGSASAHPGVATATGSVQSATTASLRADVGWGQAAGSAWQPSIFATVPAARQAPAGIATATGSITNPTVVHTSGSSAHPGVATATGSGLAPRAQAGGVVGGLVFDVYAAANPNGPLLATLADATGKAVTFTLQGIGAGQFSIARGSVQATPTVLAQGNLVKVRLPDVSSTPIGAFWMEAGRFDLVGQDDAPEFLTFGGKGALAYLGRAILWSRSFVTGEPDPVDNEWRLAEGQWGSRAGTILHRLVTESVDPDRPQQPLPSMSYDFSSSVDSAGNAWSTTPGTGGLIAHVGDYLDDVVTQLLGTTSMVVQMDASLGLHAYNSMGTDRTSATFAAGKVRLERGANIATALTREIAADRMKSHILTAGDPGYYGSAASAATPVREGFASSSGTDTAALDALASSQLAIRTSSAESARLEVPYGNVPLSGWYLPGPAALGGHYWLGDTVTVHTGTAVWDYNASAQVIAEITLTENDAGVPVSTVALGSSYSGSAFAVIDDAINQARTDLANSTNAAVRIAYATGHPRVVDILPVLPDSTFPIGSQVFLTTDEKLYLNPDDIAWTVTVDAVDITGQITETQIADDAISTPMLQAGAVTAGNIAAGAIEALHMTADSVTTGVIAAGAVSAEALVSDLVIAGKFLTATPPGRRVEIDGAGIRNYGVDEQLLVNIPTVGTEPVSVKGAIEASSLVSTATAELRGVNTLAAGSVSTLQVGVVDPVAAPLVAVSVPYLPLVPVPPQPGHGLAYDPSGGAGGVTPTFWVGANPAIGNQLDLAYEYDASSGALLRTLRKTGTTTTQTATIGSTSHVSDTAEASTGTTNSQIATPLTMPRDGTITRVSVWLAGYGGAANVRNVLWTAGGTALSESSAYSAINETFDNGASNHYDRALQSGVTLSSGTSFLAGFVRTSSGDGFQWDRDDGAGKTTKKGDGLDGSMTSITTDSSHKPNVSVTYTYTVDTSVEGDVGQIVGVARQGAYVWILDSNGWLYRYNQAGLTFVSKHNLSAYITGKTAWAGLGFDGTVLVIATTQTQAAGSAVRMVRVSTAGAYITTQDVGMSINGGTTSTRGAYFDGTRYWIPLNGGTTGVYAFTTGNIANRDFGLGTEIHSGVTFDGTYFCGYASSAQPGRINRFTNWDWTTESAVYWVGYTWYDLTGTPHESMISPRTTLTLGRRRQMTVSTPALPGAASEPPDRTRVYLARGAADPGATGFKLQITDAATARTFVTFDGAGAADPASNNFPVGTAALLQSVKVPGWILSADGTAKLQVLGTETTNTGFTVAGGGTATFTGKSMRWCRIGDAVLLSLTFTINASGSGGTTVSITGTGLPQAANAARVMGDRGGSSVFPIVFRMVNASGEAQPTLGVVNATGFANVTGVDLVNGQVYTAVGMYFTADAWP